MRHLIQRLLLMIPLLFLISVAAFLLVKAAPGGPFQKERGGPPEVERSLRARYHLDEPIWKQYLHYVTPMLHGDFGPSMVYRSHSVNDVIRQGLPVSMTLGGLAFLFAWGIGLPLGFWSAARRGRWQDYTGSLVALLFVCIPGLVVAPLLIITFAVSLRWFPVGLWETPWHAVLPTVALGLYFGGKIARLLREGMLGTLNAEFVKTARSKGLSETQVLRRHALPLAVLPVVSYSGPLLADLLTGSFVVENIFQIPGIGVFFVNSFNNRDHLMMVSLVLLYAVILLLLNLAVDFLYTVLDPRIRYD